MDRELCNHGNDAEAYECCPICLVNECAADYAMSLAEAGLIAYSDVPMTYDCALLGLAQTNFVSWLLLNMTAEYPRALFPEIVRAHEYALACSDAEVYWSRAGIDAPDRDTGEWLN